MRVYQCDSCNKVISDPYEVEMKEFYLGADIDCFSLTGIAIPIPRKRTIKIQLCDDCYKGLHLIAEKKEHKNNV